MKMLPTKQFKTGRTVIDWKNVLVGNIIDIHNSKLNQWFAIEIKDNKQVVKISKKTSKERKERRLWVNLHGYDAVSEIGTEAMKKGSFIGKLAKLSNYTVPECKKDIKSNSDIDALNWIKNRFSMPLLLTYTPKEYEVPFGLTDDQLHSFVMRKFTKAVLKASDEDTSRTRAIKKVYREFVKLYHPDVNPTADPRIIKKVIDFYKGVVDIFED